MIGKSDIWLFIQTISRCHSQIWRHWYSYLLYDAFLDYVNVFFVCFSVSLMSVCFYASN